MKKENPHECIEGYRRKIEAQNMQIRNLKNGSTIKGIKAQFQAFKDEMKKEIDGYEERQQRYVKILTGRGLTLV